jgi:hypothetical protein
VQLVLRCDKNLFLELMWLTGGFYFSGHNADDVAETVIMNGKCLLLQAVHQIQSVVMQHVLEYF